MARKLPGDPCCATRMTRMARMTRRPGWPLCERPAALPSWPCVRRLGRAIGKGMYGDSLAPAIAAARHSPEAVAGILTGHPPCPAARMARVARAGPVDVWEGTGGHGRPWLPPPMVEKNSYDSGTRLRGKLVNTNRPGGEPDTRSPD